MFAPSFFDQPAHRYNQPQYQYNQPQWGYSSNPYARRSPFGQQQQPRRYRQPRQYYTQAEMLELQRQEQQRQQLLQLQRERQAAAALQQRKEAALKRQERIRQRSLFLIRAKMAARTIQRTWRAYCERRDGVLQAKRDAASVVITRAMRNFPTIMQAKNVVASLQELKHIAQQVEDVDPATAIKIGAGITVFENTMEKLVAKIDLIDSWGSPLVRYMRKQIVLRANERIARVCRDEAGPKTLKPTTTYATPTPTSTTATPIPTPSLPTTSDHVHKSDQGAAIKGVVDVNDNANDSSDYETTDDEDEHVQTMDETIDPTFEVKVKAKQQPLSYATIATQCQEKVRKDLNNKLTSLIDQLKTQVEELNRNKDSMDTDTIENTITKINTATKLLR